MLGESELYDEVCDRLDATNDGERAGAIELALEGLYLARKISKESGGGETSTARRPPRTRYGRYAGGPDPLAPAGRPRRGAGRHRRGRDGRLLARARDARVPAPRRPGPARPRRPGPPGRREASRAAASSTTSTAPCRRSASCSTAPCSRSASSWPATSTSTTPTARSARCSSTTCRRHRGRGQRAVRLRLAEPRGARGLRADQGPARPRDARPALRRHEAGARERHRRGPRSRSTRCSPTSTSCSSKHRARRGHRPGLRRVHGQARRLLPREPAEHRRADRRARPAGRRRPADAQLDDRGAARRADALSQQAFGSPGADAVSSPSSTPTSSRCGPARTGAAPSSSTASRASASATAPACSRTSPTSTSSPSSSPSRYGGARMDDVDLDKLARQLGDEAAVDARTLQRLEQALRDTGYLKRGSDGQLKLSPKAMRQLGKALLRDVANRMSGRQGQRDLRQAGAAGERSGRHPRVGVRRHRAVGRDPHDHQRRRRHASADGRRPAPSGVRLDIRDIEVEPRPRRAPRRRSRCWSTRRSRWRWTAAGCR